MGPNPAEHALGHVMLGPRRAWRFRTRQANPSASLYRVRKWLPIFADDFGRSDFGVRLGSTRRAQHDEMAPDGHVVGGWPASAQETCRPTIQPSKRLPLTTLLRRSTLPAGAIWAPGWYVSSRVVTIALWERWGRPVEWLW
jgi:hypothetical protein